MKPTCKYERDMYERAEQSAGGRIVVQIVVENIVLYVRGAVVAHDAVEMVTVEDTAEQLGHAIGWINQHLYINKIHETTLEPLLVRAILYIHMWDATAETVVLGDEGRALIIILARVGQGNGRWR
jgi:hypothetical protein